MGSKCQNAKNIKDSLQTETLFQSTSFLPDDCILKKE